MVEGRAEETVAGREVVATVEVAKEAAALAAVERMEVAMAMAAKAEGWEVAVRVVAVKVEVGVVTVRAAGREEAMVAAQGVAVVERVERAAAVAAGLGRRRRATRTNLLAARSHCCQRGEPWCSVGIVAVHSPPASPQHLPS